MGEIKILIKRRRDELRMTQAALAKLTGIAQTKLSAYENNAICPSVASLQKIAAALETNLDELIEKED